MSDSAEQTPTTVDDDGQGPQLSLPEPVVDRTLLAGLAGSLLLHVLPLATMLGVFTLGGIGGGGEEDQRRLGDEKGKLEGVNVEIVDAAEYDRRYMSHTDGPGTGSATTAPSRPSPSQPAEQQPEQPAEPEKPAEQAAEQPAEPEKPAEMPAAPKQALPERRKPAETGLTEKEAEELIRAAQSELTSVAEASSKASLAALGSASPAIRSIMRRLKSAMPKSPGVRGSVVVRIVLNEKGGLASLALVQGSGKSDLDNRVLESVRRTLQPDAANSLAPKERLLQITYEYF